MTLKFDEKLASLEQAVKDAEELKSSIGLTAVIGLFVGGAVGFAVGGNGYNSAERLYQNAVKQLEDYKSSINKR